MKTHFFCIYNNNQKLCENTKRSIDGLALNANQVFSHFYSNEKSEYRSIRLWINDVLEEINNEENQDLYKDSIIFFIHQDVGFDKQFLESFLSRYNEIPDKQECAVFGFAGVDSNGAMHSFMKDSSYFSFYGIMENTIVDSVDEYFFGIEANKLIENKIVLSNIEGWHAYSVEFSILFLLKGYKTIYMPLFTEHNSKRSNNKGLYPTHYALYERYKTTLNTTCGRVMEYSKFGKFKKSIYSIYLNNIKFEFEFLEKIKYLILDCLNIKFSFCRYLNFSSKNKNISYYYLDNSGKDSAKEVTVELSPLKKINFRTISNIKDIDFSRDETIVVKGIRNKMKGFKYIKHDEINIRK